MPLPDNQAADGQVEVSHWVTSAIRQSGAHLRRRLQSMMVATPAGMAQRMMPRRQRRAGAWKDILRWHYSEVPAWVGVLATLPGIALLTGLVYLLRTELYSETIPLIYCVAVLAIALYVGRVPAIAAAVISLMLYGWLFVPSVTRVLKGFQVGLVLALALLLIWFRVRAVIDTRRHLAGLFDLAQLVASTPDEQTLLSDLTDQAFARVQSIGVKGFAVIAPASVGKSAATDELVVIAAASAYRRKEKDGAWPLQTREQGCEAKSAYAHGKVCLYAGGKRIIRNRDTVTYYAPLRRQGHIVGVAAIRGRAGATVDLAHAVCEAADMPRHPPAEKPRDERIDMLHAYCSHIAATLDRMKWHQQAIHVEALRRSDQLKNALLASVAHDLGTPVTALSLAVDNLLKSGLGNSDDPQREQLLSMRSEIDRLNRLTHNSLSLVKLEEGVAPPRKDWFFIAEVIGTVLDRLEKAGRSQGRTIVQDIPASLPLIHLDRDQIENVLGNLIENALIYSPPETSVSVRAQVLNGPRRLMVQVSDDGPGVPPEAQPHIFDKYYRVHGQPSFGTLEQQHKGSGLGLAICHAIVRLHGGKIGVESARGAGATFWFTVPMKSDPPLRPLPDD